MDSGFRHAGVETTTVPYKAGVEANTALLGGHIEAVASTDFGPPLKAGQIRLLVETGPHKIPGEPQVPTFRELKYPLSVISLTPVRMNTWRVTSFPPDRTFTTEARWNPA